MTAPEPSAVAPTAGLPSRVEVTTWPRIALVTDVRGWALDNKARQLAHHLRSRFEIRIVHFADFDDPARVLMAVEASDLAHYFWRGNADQLDTEWYEQCVQRTGLERHDFESRYRFAKVISTCVQDHLFLAPDDVERRRALFTRKTHAYSVASTRLDAIYRGIAGHPAPEAILPNGVDRARFVPLDLQRFDRIDRPLVVGWVGNSRWGEGLTAEDSKGVRTILVPAVEAVRADGIDVELSLADRASGAIENDEMASFYARLDVFACTSAMEGTPNPVLEAVACGVPVISTDVGIVPQVLGPQQRRFILSERSPHCLAAALKGICADRRILRELSYENLSRAHDWDWTAIAPLYGDYFDALLKCRAEHHGATK